MSKKKLLASLLFNKLDFLFEPLLIKKKHDCLFVVAYHRVCDLPDEKYPFLEGTISVTPKVFKQQMCFVKKNFNVINFSQLGEIIKKQQPVPKNTLIITFDDGYEDNYTNAFPILKYYNLTATIFVSTNYIDTGSPFWFDIISYIIKHVDSVDHIKKRLDFLDQKDIVDRGELIKMTIREFKKQPDQERNRYINLLIDLNRKELKQNLYSLIKPLSWKQIIEMNNYDIEIGSHTVTHPFLTNLTDEQLTYELDESKKCIEKHIGRKVKSIAYPDGNYDHRVMQQVEKSGYQFGISYEHDVKKYEKSISYSIPRIHIEPDVNFSLFKANLIFPQLFMKYGS